MLVTVFFGGPFEEDFRVEPPVCDVDFFLGAFDDFGEVPVVVAALWGRGGVVRFFFF